MNTQTTTHSGLCDISIETSSTSLNSMTSLQISDLTGKSHQYNIKLIRSLIDKGLILAGKFYLRDYTDSRGTIQSMCELDESASMIVIQEIWRSIYSDTERKTKQFLVNC